MSATVSHYIEKARRRVREIVASCETDSRTVIARYTAAVAVNFTDWIGKTIPWARHELAVHALVDNLRCEAEEDHVGMLLRFAECSGALPGREDYAHTANEVAAIRQLFADTSNAGFLGVALCAILENTSEIFIPDLARRAEECGCDDLTYTEKHGVADITHSEAFSIAWAAEMTMGYKNPMEEAKISAHAAVGLIARIYGG